MADTYTLISSVTVGAGGASSIDFTSIPATYTDLKLVWSVRANTSNGAGGIYIGFNGSTTSFTGRYLEGNGASVSSGSLARYLGTEDTNFYTSNTFANGEVYIPNYTGSTNKSFSADDVSENNGTTAYATLNAGLWSNTAAINQVTLTMNYNFLQYSTAYLYGISNS